MSESVILVGLFVVIVLTLSALAIYRSVRETGLSSTDRLSRIVLAAMIGLVGMYPLAVLPKVPALTGSATVVSSAVIIVGGVLLLVLWVQRRLQERAAYRRDLSLGIPPQPRPRSWEAACGVAIAIAVASLAGVILGGVPVWVFIAAGQGPSYGSLPQTFLSDLALGGAVPCFAVGITGGLIWKLRRDRAVRNAALLTRGIRSRLDAEREIGREEGRAERTSE